jgi:hypothetical protein
MFRDVWAERLSWAAVNENEEKWLEAIGKLLPVANWTPYYQLTLVELLARIAVLSGMSEKLMAAANSGDPASFLLDIVDDIPDDAPDHPEALPLAFAMVGNLDAIARYSRSINDMAIACKAGQIDALFQAVSVDSYISTMPFFQSAMRIGQLSGDNSAADAIFKAIKGPHKKRGEYSELRWAEYLLRDQGAFQSCSRQEIYELVVEHLRITTRPAIRRMRRPDSLSSSGHGKRKPGFKILGLGSRPNGSEAIAF